MPVVRILLEVRQCFRLHPHPRRRPLDERSHLLIMRLPASSLAESIVCRVDDMLADRPLVGIVQQAVRLAHSELELVRRRRRRIRRLGPGRALRRGRTLLVLRIADMPPWAVWDAALARTEPVLDHVSLLPTSVIASFIHRISTPAGSSPSGRDRPPRVEASLA